MAFLKDLIVNGAARISGTLSAEKVNTNTILAPTSSNGSTLGPGSNGQVLISNGTSAYWGTLSHSNFTSGNINLTQSSSTNVSAYATATVRAASSFTMAGSAVTDTAVTVGTLSGSNYPVSAKVKGTVTAGTSGWFTNSGAVQATTATQVGTIPKATFERSGGNINVKTAGYIDSGTVGTVTASNLASGNKELTAQTGTSVVGFSTASVKSGAGAANSASLTANGYYSGGAISSTTDKIAMTTTATNGYYKVTASGSSKISTAGWLNTGALTAASQAYYIKKGVITNNTSGGTSTATINRGSQIKISSGYYPSDLYYTADNIAWITY